MSRFFSEKRADVFQDATNARESLGNTDCKYTYNKSSVGIDTILNKFDRLEVNPNCRRKEGKRNGREAIQTFDFSRDQSRGAKDNGRKGKTTGKGREKKNVGFFAATGKAKRKRRERVTARRRRGESRRGEILDTPKPVASPSINSTY